MSKSEPFSTLFITYCLTNKIIFATEIRKDGMKNATSATLKQNQMSCKCTGLAPNLENVIIS